MMDYVPLSQMTHFPRTTREVRRRSSTIMPPSIPKEPIHIITSEDEQLKDKTLSLQVKLVEECKKWMELEALVGNIPTKIQEYKSSLKKMLQYREMGMQGFTSSILVAAMSIGKASLDEATSTGHSLMLDGGPSRHTRQSTKKYDLQNLVKRIHDSLKEVTWLGYSIFGAIKELI